MLFQSIMEMNHSKIYTLIMTTFVLLALNLKAESNALNLTSQAKAELKNQGETVSLELSGQKDWNYDLKRSVDKGQTKVTLSLKNQSDANYDKIVNTQNAFIKSINIISNKLDQKKQIEFILVNDKVETFDYLTDFPSKLIVDFYINEAPTVEIKSTLKKSEEKISKNSILNKKVKRNIAGLDSFTISDFDKGELNQNQINLQSGLFNKSDDQFSRFQIGNIDMNKNPRPGLSEFFMAYPLIDQDYSFWNKIKLNYPDYEIQRNDSDENKQIRLVQKLYEKKRILVLKKTTDWFAAKYPHSKYLDMAYGMTADLLAQEWFVNSKPNDFEAAQYYYSKINALNSHSLLSERASLFSGYLDLNKKNYLSALRKFKTHTENEDYKTAKSKFYADLGIVDCLMKLNKPEDALKNLELVENSSTDSLIKAEASYRKADILMSQEKFLDAKNQYALSQKQFPQFAELFPNGIFNKMEALYQLKQNKESHAEALDFIKKFPMHPQAPYAMTRLGELLEMIGAPQEKSMGAYLETHFRYGDSPKAVVARLHLLTSKMKDMNENELTKTLEKIEELSLKSELKNIDQFKSVMVSDGFTRRKDYNTAIDTLVKYNQRTPNQKNLELVNDRIRDNIYDYLKHLSENDRHSDVLKTHKKYSDNMLRKKDEPDMLFYIGKAYQAAGLHEDALKQFNAAEKKLLKSVRKIQVEDLYLQQSQALVEKNDLHSAELILDKIKNPEKLSAENQIKRVQVASQLYEKKGDQETALRYLSEIVRVWKADPNLVTASAIHAAKIYNKLNQAEKGLSLLNSLDTEKLSTNNLRAVHKTKSSIAIQAKLLDPAINALEYLVLHPVENKDNQLAEEKYTLGDLYSQKGELKKAENTWASLNEKEDSFWAKMASEKMKSLTWLDENKKYIKRIPAAVGVQ